MSLNTGNKFYRVCVSLILGMLSTVSSAADIASVLPTQISQDSIPPEGGRSLFDHLMIAKKPDGTWQYDFKEPDASLAPEVRKKKYFEVFLDQIVARARGNSTVPGPSPTVVLIPGGRSLQRAAGDLTDPRRVVAFSEHFTPVTELGLTLRDRIFIGHSPRNNQIEVISYNEAAGRFEFQLVNDFGIPGKKPVVRYANRALCATCHRTETPIFSTAPWEEVNSRTVVGESIKWANKGAISLDGKYALTNSGGDGDAYAVNDSAQRSRELHFMQLLWQKGCRIIPAQAASLQLPSGYRSEDCRAQLASFALLRLIKTPALPFTDMAAGPAGIPYIPHPKLVDLIESNLSPLEYKYLTVPSRDPYQKYAANPIFGNPNGDAAVRETLFREIAAIVKADVGTGLVMADAISPVKAPLQDLFTGSPRPVKTGVDLVIGRLKDMFTNEQIVLLRTKGGLNVTAGPATILELYKTLRNAAAFADKPFRRGLFVEAVFDGLNIKPPGAASTCCTDVEGFPPVVLTDDTSHQPGLSSERQILQRRCLGCHDESNPDFNYLEGTDGMPERAYWRQVLSHELKWTARDPVLPVKMDLCRRLNWTLPLDQLPIINRMPFGSPADPQLRKEILKGELLDGNKSERKIVMDAIKAKLQEIGQASDSSARREILQAIMARAANGTPAEIRFWNGFNSDSQLLKFGTLMTKIALESNDCKWTPMKAEDPL